MTPGDLAGAVVLFAGPAGAGKSTLARAWCARQNQAVHVELDAIRGLIVSGRADPQVPSEGQTEQYALSVAACCSLAREFAQGGYFVAIDDVIEPDAFERHWRDRLDGLDWRLVVVLPSLEETLGRSLSREKRVREEHTRAQHAASEGWPERARIDTTGLTLEESVALVASAIEEPRP